MTLHCHWSSWGEEPSTLSIFCLLTYFMPLTSFYIPWKYQMTSFDVFRLYRKRSVAWNRSVSKDDLGTTTPLKAHTPSTPFHPSWGCHTSRLIFFFFFFFFWLVGLIEKKRLFKTGVPHFNLASQRSSHRKVFCNNRYPTKSLSGVKLPCNCG